MANYRILLCAGISLAATIPQAAYAQTDRPATEEKDEAGAAAPGDIIVTARRSEERLQDVPISITVFTQEQLTNRNLTNGSELATYTPSLSVNSRYGPESASFSIRGFNQDQNSAPAVGVYFADVAVPRAQGSTGAGNGPPVGSLFDLASVQVLKGPQGTLFGRNTTGGAVLLVPQKPTHDLEGYVEGSLGNYDMRRVQAVLNIPISDTLRVRLGGDHQVRDGYLTNISGIGPKDFGDVNYTSLRLSVVADLTPDLENYTIVTYGRSSTNGIIPKPFTQPAAVIARDPFPAARAAEIAQTSGHYWDVENGLPQAFQTIEQWAAINTTTWSASDALTVKNIISYSEFRQRQATNIYGENSYFDPAAPFYSVNLLPAPNGGYNAAQSTFTEELQLQGRLAGDRLTYQVGGYLELSDPIGGFQRTYSVTNSICTDIYALQCRTLPGNVNNPVNFGFISYSQSKYRFRDLGIYGQATYKFTDKLSLTAGIRYTSDVVRGVGQPLKLVFNPNPAIGLEYQCGYPDIAVGGHHTSAEIQANGSVCNVSARQKSAKPTWLIDLDYKPIDNILLYAKYSRGYRQGGLNVSQYGLDPWSPEKVDAYEIGAKTSWRGPVSGSLNVAAFYNDFSDQQLTIGLVSCNLLPAASQAAIPTCVAAGGSFPSSAAGIANTGKSRIKGVEVEGSISPFEGFTIDGNYTYLDTKLTKSGTVAIPVGFFLLSPVPQGGPLPLAPKNKYTINVSYELPLDESIGKITLSGNFSHQGSSFGSTSSVPADQILPPQNNLNLNLNWNGVLGSPVDLGLFATNVTREKFQIQRVGASFGWDAAVLNLPRMYGIRLRYNLGK
jgi:iron complex outermembrane receptor protein